MQNKIIFLNFNFLYPILCFSCIKTSLDYPAPPRFFEKWNESLITSLLPSPPLPFPSLPSYPIPFPSPTLFPLHPIPSQAPSTPKKYIYQTKTFIKYILSNNFYTYIFFLKISLGQGGSVCKIRDRSVQLFYHDDETYKHPNIHTCVGL